MKTVIYTRVSTLDQNISMQLREISSFLQSKGISDYQVYSDEGASGKNMDRPKFKTLLNEIKQGKVALLVVYKLDRLSRSLTQLLDLLMTLKQYNVELISIKDNIDMTTPSGKLMLHIIGAFAEFERSIIIERTKSGLDNAKSKGRILGRPSNIGVQTIDQVLFLKSQGTTIRAIAEATKISKSSVQHIINTHKVSRSSTVQEVTNEIE